MRSHLKLYSAIEWLAVTWNENSKKTDCVPVQDARRRPGRCRQAPRANGYDASGDRTRTVSAHKKTPPERMGFLSHSDTTHFVAGGLSPVVSTLCVSVTVAEPSGVVTVVSVFLVSAFLSQPTENTVARLKTMQSTKKRFMMRDSFNSLVIQHAQTIWFVLSAYDLRCSRRAIYSSFRKKPENWQAIETELANDFPIHVVCAWMGNAEAVAKSHYLHMTDDYFERDDHAPVPVNKR
jgi:hypothetical protein